MKKSMPMTYHSSKEQKILSKLYPEFQELIDMHSNRMILEFISSIIKLNNGDKNSIKRDN